MFLTYFAACVCHRCELMNPCPLENMNNCLYCIMQVPQISLTKAVKKGNFKVGKCGSTLLIDGWWAYARKIHYTCDVVFALSWGLVCRFTHALPYFYFIFFVGMIAHRYQRDVARCATKYGEDWDIYCWTVPYVFVPGVF